MNETARRLVAIYADESCLGNGQERDSPGGAAGVVEYRAAGGNAENIVRKDYWISEPATTNNRMALRSVIEAFHLLSAKKNSFDVVFTSDSQYLIKGMTEWVHSWSARGWRRKTGAVENLDLWIAALRAVGDNRVQWRWVRGHDGHPQNAYADSLATGAAARLDSSHGWADSHFAEWLDRERNARRIRTGAESFPSHELFRPSRALPRPPEGGASEVPALWP
jgi:ribonuclease HI